MDSLEHKIIDNLYNDIVDLLGSTLKFMDNEGRTIREDLGLLKSLEFALTSLEMTSVQIYLFNCIGNYKLFIEGTISKEKLLEACSVDRVPEVGDTKVPVLQPLLERTEGIRSRIDKHFSNIGV